MFVKFSDPLIFLGFIVCFLFLGYTESFGQKRKAPRKTKPVVISCGVCNQKAIFLPKPEYPKAAKFVGASGKVAVQILIDEKGNVIEAKAVSGHPLLRASSVKAAFQAKFEPLLLSGKAVRVSGVIVYNFEDEFLNQPEKPEEAINLPIINGKASYLPIPEYPPEAADFCAGGKVEIEVLIGETGDVLEAEAISGDELLRAVSVEAVRKAKFYKTGHMQPIKLKGIVVYNFDSLAPKCITVGIVNKKAIYLPKPIVSPDIKATGSVEVVIIIDSLTGKILSAKAISGHPLLRTACVASARNAKFSPINDVPQVRLRGTLVYTFKPDGTIKF